MVPWQQLCCLGCGGLGHNAWAIVPRLSPGLWCLGYGAWATVSEACAHASCSASGPHAREHAMSCPICWAGRTHSSFPASGPRARAPAALRLVYAHQSSCPASACAHTSCPSSGLHAPNPTNTTSGLRARTPAAQRLGFMHAQQLPCIWPAHASDHPFNSGSL